MLKRDLGKIDAIRAKATNCIPTVLSKDEVGKVLALMSGMPQMIAQLLYGCGMRISECLRLRVKDFDFEQGLIAIHCSKGNKSRFAPLPKQMIDPIRKLIESRRFLHERDLANGEASVWLPHALDRKYPERIENSNGSFSSRRANSHATQGRANAIGIISIEIPLPAICGTRSTRLGSAGTRHRIPSGIRLRLICCRMEPIYEPYKNCWGIKTLPPP